MVMTPRVTACSCVCVCAPVARVGTGANVSPSGTRLVQPSGAVAVRRLDGRVRRGERGGVVTVRTVQYGWEECAAVAAAGTLLTATDL